MEYKHIYSTRSKEYPYNSNIFCEEKLDMDELDQSYMYEELLDIALKNKEIRACVNCMSRMVDTFKQLEEMNNALKEFGPVRFSRGRAKTTSNIDNR